MGSIRVDFEALEDRRMFAVGAVVDLPASALSMLMPVLSGAITPSSHADEPAVGPWLHEYDVKKIVPAPVSDSPVLKKIPVVDEPVEADPGGTTPAAPVSFADSVNAFGADLYAQLRAANPSANIAFSPYSAEAALAMIYGGAGGATREQMSAALHLPADEQTLLNQVMADHSLVGDIPGDNLAADLANQLWVDQRLPLNPDFAAGIASAFGGGIETADFSDNNSVKDAINQWVSDRTHGKIPELFDHIDPRDQLALVNAVYFNAQWARPFDPSDTSNGTFSSDAGVASTASLMHENTDLRYYENADVQVVDLPYQGGEYSMTVVLPKQGGLASIDSKLTAANLSQWVSSAQQEDVALTLPKFTINAGYNLIPALQALGMTDAFTDHADFSGVSSTGLEIDQVVQKDFISVGEKGTEAAAATGVTAKPLGFVIPDEVFTANHPFYYAIRNNATGATIFSGAVIQPS